ncbi:MAG: ribosome silencing factor [Elusimicrobia bacterium]|nr:ribosome silencing factor [Elusimicrobiota bacterium]
MAKHAAEASPFKFVAIAAARAAYDKKGEEILLLNVRTTSGVADYMLLVSVTSPAHLEALESEIEDTLAKSGVELRHRDGSHSGLWRVLDFGGLLVHLMHAEARSFYALDKLYHDAPKQRWQTKAA